MAERRMFAKTIINSARFLKMPSETQALYFHLGLNADDDGIVEAFSICRSIGASEDNLKILVAKGFVNVLNDDLVTHITDWNEHNKIRPDRKIDSIYKDLLLQVNPSIKLIEKKPRADKKHIGTDNGRTMDGIGKDRIGKDRIGEDNIYIKDADILSLDLYNKILTVNPSFKSDYKKWIPDIEKMLRIDKRDILDIQKCLNWIYSDGKFWIPNIMSGKKLREKFDTLFIQMNSKPQQNYQAPKSRAESNRYFIREHYGINEDGNIIDTEIM